MAASVSMPMGGLIVGENPYIVRIEGEVQVEVPQHPLASGSLVIVTSEPKNYLQWIDSDISISFALLQKVARTWREVGTSENYITDQFLVYGRQHYPESIPDPFQWEIVPYYYPIFGKFYQQFHVLKAIVFGGADTTEESMQATQGFYQENFCDGDVQRIFEETIGNDPFCNPDRIVRQRALEGSRINVLFNYAPIGFDGERLHFLIIPKAHKESFNDLSEEEYQEAVLFSQLLMTHLSLNRPVHDVHLFHKTGVIAGQTIPHWHMHMVVTLSETQALMGKLTELKNMLIGSSPMNDEELTLRINDLIDAFQRDPSQFPYSVRAPEVIQNGDVDEYPTN